MGTARPTQGHNPRAGDSSSPHGFGVALHGKSFPKNPPLAQESFHPRVETRQFWAPKSRTMPPVSPIPVSRSTSGPEPSHWEKQCLNNPGELLSHLPGPWMLPKGCNDLRQQVPVFIKAHCSPELHPGLLHHFIFQNAAPQPCSKHTLPACPASPYCLFWKEICYQLSIAVASI